MARDFQIAGSAIEIDGVSIVHCNAKCCPPGGKAPGRPVLAHREITVGE